MSGSSEAFWLDCVKRLRSRWALTLCVFAGLFICILAIVLWMPDKYESRLKIVAKNDRIDSSDSSSNPNQGRLRATSGNEPQINTEILLLTGSKVLSEVVKACRLDDLIVMEGSPEVRQQAALRQLQKVLVVAAIRDSNIIELSYESTDAKRSVDVLNAVLQSYNLVYRRMHSAPGSLGYYERLSADYGDQLAQAQAALSRFRNEHNIPTPPAVQTLAAINERQRSTSFAGHLNQNTNTVTQHDQRAVPNRALVQKLSSLLVTLEDKRSEWALLYQSDDPLLTGLDAEIVRAQAALTQAKQASSSQDSNASNPTTYVTRSELGADIQVQTDELARQSASDHAGSLADATDSAEYKQLMRKASDLEALDLSFRKKVQEASLVQSPDQQPVSNLTIVDGPSTPTTPSSPNRGLLLSLGFLCSALLASISVVVVETLAEKGFRIEWIPSNQSTPSRPRRSSSRSSSSTASRAKPTQSASRSTRPVSHRHSAQTIVVPAQEQQSLATRADAENFGSFGQFESSDQMDAEDLDHIPKPAETIHLALGSGDVAGQLAVVPASAPEGAGPSSAGSGTSASRTRHLLAN